MVLGILLTRSAQNRDKVGDNDVDDNAPMEPPPSRHEAFQAKITIEKYIQAIDEP